LTPWIRDPEWVKNQDPDSGSGSGMNISDHISESLEKFLGLKYFNSLMRMHIRIRDPGIYLTLDPGSGMKKFGSGINIPYP
jgi:hypothetical protein